MNSIIRNIKLTKLIGDRHDPKIEELTQSIDVIFEKLTILKDGDIICFYHNISNDLKQTYMLQIKKNGYMSVSTEKVYSKLEPHLNVNDMCDFITYMTKEYIRKNKFKISKISEPISSKDILRALPNSTI
jgi:hypothetical protein